MRKLSRVLILALVAAACSDDGVTTEADPLAPFVGTWNASSFVYTSVENSAVSVPVLQAIPGSSVSVVIAADGSFLAPLNLGPQTNGETVSIPGTITPEGGSKITVTFETNPFFTAPLDVTFSFQTANTLSWEAPATFDFNQDGEGTPAILTVVFQRN
jgi:hypothetical protein